MNKRSSASARVFAVTALVIAFVIAIIAISSSLGGEDSGDSGPGKQDGKAAHKTHPKKVPATYEVKSGDTLIAIAHRMGISVRQIEELNPEVDPQILVAGEQLKLR
ncbi:MAG TPA: LysM domain-containing protein [Solirubrobacterales bacterium]|nr:LysM domain-containing protein [Solirubrobacterales bacterium]